MKKHKTIKFLLSSEAAEMRNRSRKPAFVVHAEIRPHEFVELDADDAEHGHRLAAMWCDSASAISAAVRKVLPDGSLSKIDGSIHASWI